MKSNYINVLFLKKFQDLEKNFSKVKNKLERINELYFITRKNHAAVQMELEDVKRKGASLEIKYFKIEEEFDQLKKKYFVSEKNHAAVQMELEQVKMHSVEMEKKYLEMQD